ncbi:MAG: VCBS repeat-containing protein, partial [Myxococcota bacterium]|nr:VCBS repeat-containing protein [Myxococcota bacterium]
PVEPPKAMQQPLEGGPFPGILLTQAWFWTDEYNKPKPGPARLEIWRQGPDGWMMTRVEDSESNVFHKALSYQGGILTIGAEGALMKKWSFSEGTWKGDLLWKQSWGGKFNRLRDIEVGDVDHDGEDELVLATHDSGVVAVYQSKDNITELDKKADTFVHEIEIGDIDGDGKKEFFATPSDRNTAKKSQGGSVVMYRFDGEKYQRTVVETMEKTHAKEILVTDTDGDGTDELYVVKEAVQASGGIIITPVQIWQYMPKDDGSFAKKLIHTIKDSQTRFLISADLNHDGKKDLVVASMKAGLWLLERSADSKWTPSLIDKNSSGFEHSIYAADLDGDGKKELYVAADNQGELNRYLWDGNVFQKDTIGKIPKNTITWNITAGSF